MRQLLSVLTSVLVVGSFACGNKPAGPVDPVEGLSVQPDGATIDDTSTLQMRARGQRRSGASADVSEVKWTAEGSGSIDASGLLTPSAAGTVTVTAAADGFTATATITIVSPGTASIRVIDAVTGAPISGATVRVHGEADVVAGGDGVADVTGGSFTDAIDVTAWAAGYWPITIQGAVVKNLSLPLRPQVSVEPGLFSGKMEFETAFGSPEPAAGSLYLGFVASSLRGNILAFEFEDLLGDDRPISLGGIDVDAPSNLYVHNVTSDYEARTPPGSTAVFALGGEVELSVIVDIAGQVEDLSFGLIIQELIPIFNTFYFTARDDLSVAAGGNVVDFNMDLDLPINHGSTVTAPTFPVNDPNPLVVAAVDLGERGLLPTGFGIVENGQAVLQTAPPDADVLVEGQQLFALVAREGGIDSDAKLVYGVLQRVADSKSVELPQFLPAQVETDYSSVASVPGTPGNVGFPSVSGADFNFVTVVGEDINLNPIEWDVVTAASLKSAVWPFADTETGVPVDALTAGGNFSIQQVGLDFHTFQSLITDGSATNLTNYVNDGNRLVVYNGDIP